MFKKTILPAILIVLVLTNLYQYNLASHYRRAQHQNTPLLIQAATGKTTPMILDQPHDISTLDLGILYNEYSNIKKNFLYILLTNQNLFSKEDFGQILKTVNDRRFENYLLQLYNNKEMTEKDIGILNKYKEKYLDFLTAISNDVSLTSVNNFNSAIFSYSNFVEQVNHLVVEQ